MTHKFALIICTYMRPKSLLMLLDSVKQQSLYPNEIIIVDGSTDNNTQQILAENKFNALTYFKVNELDRGLTKQRNYGLKQLSEDIEIVCFLDDDIKLTKTYFEELLKTYSLKNNALAVGGYIVNESNWVKGKCEGNSKSFYYDGWVRAEPLRYRLRKKLKLLPDVPPGFVPSFSHGRPTSFLPPSGKVYRTTLIMGGVSSYKKAIFNKIRFSPYFEGYGLYEDADFSIRTSQLGELYVNTNAKLYHYHDESGRPNKYNYGKMVIRNGWYVWRTKNPTPSLNDKIKWNSISLVLTILRFSNVFNTGKPFEAFTESFGRIVGWWSLILNKPK